MIFKKSTKVYLDTNFLLIPGQLKVDIFTDIEKLMDEKYELIVLEGVKDELHKLSQGKSKDALAATLASALIRQYKRKPLKVVSSSKDKSVDDHLVLLATEKDYVATVDAELKTRLKQKGVKLLTLKQKSYVVKA